jgi:hypothetical protein
VKYKLKHSKPENTVYSKYCVTTIKQLQEFGHKLRLMPLVTTTIILYNYFYPGENIPDSTDKDKCQQETVFYTTVNRNKPAKQPNSYPPKTNNSLHFMAPEGSLPCSQGPNTSPCPGLDESSPCHPTLVL